MSIIAITVKSSAGNEQLVDERFGRAEKFLIFDLDSNSSELVDNPNLQLGQGVGVKTANFLADKEVRAVISVNFGPKAASTLKMRGIKMFQASGLTVAEAVTKFKSNELTEVV